MDFNPVLDEVDGYDPLGVLRLRDSILESQFVNVIDKNAIALTHNIKSSFSDFFVDKQFVQPISNHCDSINASINALPKEIVKMGIRKILKLLKNYFIMKNS